MSTTCTVLIITRDRHAVIERCLDGLRRQTRRPEEVLIVDSSPGQQTAEILRRYPEATYVRVNLPSGTRPASYTVGAQRAQGDVVALLDDDAIPDPRWLEETLAVYGDPRVGAVGGRVLSNNPDSDPMSDVPAARVGRVLPNGRISSHCSFDGPAPFAVDVLRGCNMSVRRRVFDEIGYFDARYTGPNTRVEDDVCLRIKRAGYAIMFAPKAVVTHLAAERVDVPRAGDHPRSVFYVARNTVYFFLKNVGWRPVLLWHLLVWNPVVDGARYACVGGLRRCRGLTLKGVRLALVNWWGSWVGLAVSLAALGRRQGAGR